MFIKKTTCFKAALTWEFSAKSSALLLWEVDWVAGEEGLIFKGCDDESRPKKTFKQFFLLRDTNQSEFLTLHFSLRKFFHCKNATADILSLH